MPTPPGSSDYTTYCSEFTKQLDQYGKAALAAATPNRAPGDPSPMQLRRDFNRAMSEIAPDAIKQDWAARAEGTDRGIAGGQTPAQMDEYETAGDRIVAWLQANCGVTVTRLEI